MLITQNYLSRRTLLSLGGALLASNLVGGCGGGNEPEGSEDAERNFPETYRAAYTLDLAYPQILPNDDLYGISGNELVRLTNRGLPGASQTIRIPLRGAGGVPITSEGDQVVFSAFHVAPGGGIYVSFRNIDNLVGITDIHSVRVYDASGNEQSRSPLPHVSNDSHFLTQLFADDSGDIYRLDASGKVIHRFAPDGTFRIASVPSGAAQFDSSPFGTMNPVAFTRSGEASFVPNETNGFRRLVRYSRDGILLDEVRLAGSRHFLSLRVDSVGNRYIASVRANPRSSQPLPVRIQKLTPDGKERTFFDVATMTDTLQSVPFDFDVDTNQNLYVSNESGTTVYSKTA